MGNQQGRRPARPEVGVLPKSRPPAAVVEAVAPLVDGGRFPAKVSVGETVNVIADVFTAGHDAVAAAVLWRRVTGSNARTPWSEAPMEALGNDRFAATLTPNGVGRWEYDVLGWVDHGETWLQGTVRKVLAGVDVTLELIEGEHLVSAMADHAAASGATDDHDELCTLADQLRHGDTTLLVDDRWSDVFWRHGAREPIARLPQPVPVDVDPELARFSAWYEFFPRSPLAPAEGPRTLSDAMDRLDDIASMGFDVVYLPPVNPIGTTKRKGPNNTPVAGDGDVGSPWAIGAPTGGHTAVEPSLGTLDDVRAFGDACRERGMQLALDIAFQCAPDHPWVTEHPEWFAHRADGSIQYAENPPKKYEDIYPFDFESSDWAGLWQALADVFRFWINVGVTVFRVDNPHTKALPFWEWALPTIRREHPETVFLAEAFTRPRVMERLAKAGFNQSYTYFTWRQSSWELQEYFTDLATRTVDYFRPNAWPNTPDILTEQLQEGGRASFVSRAILASTLSPNWGVYGPAFELQERAPVRSGSEEYLDSEKYQLRQWDIAQPDSLAPLLTRLNAIRRGNPALQHLRTLWFHQTDNPGLLCYSKTDPAGVGDPIVVVVNLDPFDRQAGFVDLDLERLGLPYGIGYDAVDLLGGGTYRWAANRNYVDLAPWSTTAHILAIRPIGLVASQQIEAQ